MGQFVIGDLVVLPFPSSTAPGSKRRPAIVVASWAFGSSTDYLMCMVSSQRVPDPYLVALSQDDVEGGTLDRQSYVRPTYLFTADEEMILYRIGHLKPARLSEVLAKIVSLFEPT